MGFSYYWSPEKQKDWNLKQLIAYLKNYVFPYHPYYRKRYRELGITPQSIRTYDDIQKLPLVTKADMLEDFKAFILQPTFPGRQPLYDTEKIHKRDLLKNILPALFMRVSSSVTGHDRTFRGRLERLIRNEWLPIHFHLSGGTTGNPSPALYTRYDLFNNVVPVAEMVYFSGIKRDFSSLNLFPAAPHLAFFQVIMSQFLIGGSVLHTCGGSVIPTERQIELASKTKNDYIAAIPSYLTYWLETAEKMVKDGRVGKLDSFKYVFAAAEPMVPTYRERLKKQFAAIGSQNVKILDAYGMTEVKGAFYECDEGAGIHLSPEKYLWEVLDPETKAPVKEGEPGVLTFSHIGWRGTVFIRYYTGDLIKGIVWDKCPKCGVTCPRLLTPMCRAIKDFTKIKGSRVSHLDLQTAVRNVPAVESFQVVITKQKEDDPFSKDWVKVFVAAKDGFEHERVAEEIKKSVKLDCEISPNEVIFEDPAAIERRLFARTGLKADWVVDLRQIHV